MPIFDAARAADVGRSRAGDAAASLGKTDFVLAHPGHELRLFRWLELLKPRVSILTSGSRQGESMDRLAASRALVASVGGEIGPLHGVTLDRDLYRLIMDGDPTPFAGWIDRLRDAWIASPPATVVTDSWQFYSVAHDLTHLMARVAIAEATAATGRAIECLEYPVVPQSMVERRNGPVVHSVVLDEAGMQRKVATASAYPDIAGELAELIALAGLAGLCEETLHRPGPLDGLVPDEGTKPLFETFGEQRREAGLFSDVLRWRHLEPIVTALIDRHGRAS